MKTQIKYWNASEVKQYRKKHPILFQHDLSSVKLKNLLKAHDEYCEYLIKKVREQEEESNFQDYLALHAKQELKELLLYLKSVGISVGEEPITSTFICDIEAIQRVEIRKLKVELGKLLPSTEAQSLIVGVSTNV